MTARTEWVCGQTGDCCRAVREVVMHPLEAQALLAARPEVATTWRPLADGSRMVALDAGPCPYLHENRCSVYDVRPYNCRRWGCFRAPGEPLTDLAPVPLKVLRSPDLVAQYQRMQAEGQTWARAHGWHAPSEVADVSDSRVGGEVDPAQTSGVVVDGRAPTGVHGPGEAVGAGHGPETRGDPGASW